MTATTDLEIFARVARTGNMSKAGREMNLSPAVVSKRISLLEEHLGVRLFQRTTRQLTLTDIGEGYFKRVIDILSLIDEAENFVSRRSSNPRGNMRVVADTAFAKKFILPHMARFHDQYPDISFDFRVTDEDVDIIRDGYDLAIRVGNLPDSSLVAKKLAPAHRVLCAAPTYLSQHPAPTTPKDLELHRFVLSAASDEFRLKGSEHAADITLDGKVRVDSSDFARDAVLSGLGIGLLPSWDIYEDVRAGRLHLILPQCHDATDVSIYAVYPCRTYVPVKMELFLKFLTEVCASVPTLSSLDQPRTAAAPAEPRPTAEPARARRMLGK